GTEKFKQSIPLQNSSLNKLRKKAEASIKENLSRHDKQDAETTPILNELAQGLAYIESKYRQKEGKLYNYNILSHTMAYTAHIIATSALLLLFPILWIGIEPDMRLSMCIIMILFSCILPADILTLRNLEKMPYFIIYEYVHPLFPATVAYRLSLNFLEKIPVEKQEKYIPLVISKEDRKKYDIPAILEFSRSQSAESSHLNEIHTERK
ncbi:MAG: hypothetical protein IIY02_03075, partial [Firmicutes bacterium]|nr:hypothetical protein [Bacillota bacterium]